MPPVKKHTRKWRPTKRLWGLLIIFIIVPLLTIAAFAWHSNSTDELSQFATAEQGKPLENQKINILILGIDERKNDVGRSNVTCVMTVDTGSKNVSMLWVPRDSRVEIPGHGWNKIGHAYSYGGHQLSEQTVANFLGIPIDYYLAVNMGGFKKVIDALGGVDINVDKRMYYYDPYDEGEVDNNGLIDLKPGMQHMDGNTALEYVRFRHDEMGDIGRIERQQKFAKALLTDIVTPTIITKLPSAMREASSAFQTDIPVGDMIRLVKIASDVYKQGLKTEMVSGKPVYIDDLSYWLPNILAMRNQVAEIQGIQVSNNYLTDAQMLADEYKQSTRKLKVIDAP
jgi:LCP family protein required for cell wall assembly